MAALSMSVCMSAAIMDHWRSTEQHESTLLGTSGTCKHQLPEGISPPDHAKKSATCRRSTSTSHRIIVSQDVSCAIGQLIKTSSKLAATKQHTYCAIGQLIKTSSKLVAAKQQTY
eukprot:3980-Amphidinium_carterae.1